jgi:Methyltransferase domain
MLAASRAALLTRLGESDSLLDVGGWAQPLARADWVIDVMPHASRGMYVRQGWAEPDPEPERFSAETWVELDICQREPWPFADGRFDFVTCSQTLEDIRDPIWVCGEMARVARAGYVEVPSRLEEQSYGIQGPFVGWPHHRWLIESRGSHLEFVSKPSGLENRPATHFPAGFWESLSPEERVVTLWWEGTFTAAERIFSEGAEWEEHLEGFVAREMAERGVTRPRRRRLGRLRRSTEP